MLPLVGTIYYGSEATAIDIEDLALAHLKVVIATKLRRGESFTVSWRHPEDQPRGRSTIWVHPSIPLRFVFEDPEPAVLNRQWLEELANSANSTGGIQLVPGHFTNTATGPISTVPPSSEPAGAESPSEGHRTSREPALAGAGVGPRANAKK